MQGTVKRMFLDRGFGFIACHGRKDVFFHVYDLAENLPFDEQLTERRVSFDVLSDDKGDRAANIRAAD